MYLPSGGVALASSNEKMALVERVSAALARERIPHECYAQVLAYDETPYLVSIAIPSESDPMMITECVLVECGEREIREILDDFDYEEAAYYRLHPVVYGVCEMLGGMFNHLKTNRDQPLACAAVIASKKYRLHPRRMKKVLRGCEGIFIESELHVFARFARKLLTNPSFPIKMLFLIEEPSSVRLETKIVPLGRSLRIPR